MTDVTEFVRGVMQSYGNAATDGREWNAHSAMRFAEEAIAAWNRRPSAIVEEPMALAKGWGGKYGEVLTPFVTMMEAELHANSGKGDRPGWLAMSREALLLEIYYHLAKMQKATLKHEADGIREFGADVANMAMMLVDKCGALPVASLNAALTVEPEAGEVTEVDAMRRDWNKFCADIGMVVDSHDAIAEKINAAFPEAGEALEAVVVLGIHKSESGSIQHLAGPCDIRIAREVLPGWVAQMGNHWDVGIYSLARIRSALAP